MRRPGRLSSSLSTWAPKLWAALAATALATAGCSQAAHADRGGPPAARVAAPRIALAISPAKVRAPYDVQIIKDTGETMPTYAHRDRFYVQGAAGERYIIRVTNPTPNRVEAVVSVDGLDVVDGEPGDLRKRGYVVPPYGETRIEGFRTSQADVATFRFSAVADSYAGRKGKARNVGVIAVAIFEEQAPPEEQQIIVGGGGYGGFRAPSDEGGDFEDEYLAPPAPTSRGAVGQAKRAPAPPPRTAAADKASEAPASGAAAPRMRMEEDYAPSEPAPMRRPTSRPGLGTEFGEQRYSAASYTQFVRAADRPIAIAELRYNDTAGLIALGIPLQPSPDEGEIMTRETADPFPGDQRFATPPR